MRACGSRTEVLFNLRPHRLDGIEIRGVWREVTYRSAPRLDRLLHPSGLVRREVVHDDHVADPQCKSQHSLDVTTEYKRIHSPFDYQRGFDSVVAERTKHRRRTPVAPGGVFDQTLPPWCSAVQTCHVCLSPGLVQKHQRRCIHLANCLSPATPLISYVLTLLFRRLERLFLNVRSKAWTAR